MTIEDWDMTLLGMTRERYAARRRREARRRAFKAAAEAAGWVFASALFAWLVWAFLAATPPQASGEADLFRAEAAGE